MERPDKFKLTDYINTSEGETIFVAEEGDVEIIDFISVWKDTQKEISWA